MSKRNSLLVLTAITFVWALAATGSLAYAAWRGWLFPAEQKQPKEEEQAHAKKERIYLSKQARDNLRLIVEPVATTTYWRKILVPGSVVERPGTSDRGVTAPVAGVVTRVAALPGKTVRPGDELFTLRLTSESLQNSQLELYKTARELEINQKERDRLAKLAQEGTVAVAKVLELDYQKARLNAVAEAHIQDLKVRRLSDEQIRGIEKGSFVTQLVVRVPAPQAASVASLPLPDSLPLPAAPEYEVQDLKVSLGGSVQAGQTLAYLADHRLLYVEGRALRQEGPLVARAARDGWVVEIDFGEDAGGTPQPSSPAQGALSAGTGNGDQEEAPWPPFRDPLTIQYLGSTMDPTGLTFPFYVTLKNQLRQVIHDGKAHRIWRFRPGQRALLKVPVEQMPGVFVLPLEAVVREGPDAYVFRWNGGEKGEMVLDRVPVHVRYEDNERVVIANDGSIATGNYLAHNAAAVLNRVLKAAAGGAAADPHAGHSH
ncbi:MAG: hypothetical protein L0Z62_04505 [Gemmataceae bacterium]|nr:hypothetical protein [Gemmataceae bacterium]